MDTNLEWLSVLMHNRLIPCCSSQGFMNNFYQRMVPGEDAYQLPEDGGRCVGVGEGDTDRLLGPDRV